MRNDQQEILSRALSKAKENGYVLPTALAGFDSDTLVGSGYDIIFNHPFALAIWGNEMVAFEDIEAEQIGRLGPRYLYHLKEMVQCLNPYEYLDENM